jgi:dihydroneopterin aldolase
VDALGRYSEAVGRDEHGYQGDRIFLRGIEAQGCHGVLLEEHTRPQRFVVDVDAWLDADGYARADDYARAVCYADVLQVVLDIVLGPRFSLIEALGLSVAEALLNRFAQICTVQITIHKPEARLPGRVADVGVSLTRQRIRHRQ